MNAPRRDGCGQAGATTVGPCDSSPRSAAAATTYWKFKNIVTDECLTAGKTDVVYVRSCVGGDYQEWDWVGTGTYKRLKNRGNKGCLMTDHKTAVNSVWMSDCPTNPDSDAKPGQLWGWSGNRLLGNYISGFLRTSPTQGVVHAADDFFDDRCDWKGRPLI